jgi:prolipoprotein diacylglyceryltransferase
MGYPIIFSMGPVTISTVGFLACLGFFFGSFILYKKAKEENLAEEAVFDSLFTSFLVAVLVSRYFFIATTDGQLWPPWPVFFQLIKHPGFSYWGGLVGLILALAVVLRRLKTDFFEYLDILVFAGLIFHFFILIGRMIESGFGVVHWRYTLLGRQLDLPLPLLIIETLVIVFIYRLLTKLAKNYRTIDWYKNKKGEAKPGFIAFTYIIIYSFFRLLLASLKTDQLYLRLLEVFLSSLFLILAMGMIYFRSGLFEPERFKKIIGLKTLGQTKRKEASSRQKKHHIKAGHDAKLK